MKSKLLAFSAILLFVACKTQKTATASSDAQEVTIVNVGELMSTYNLKEDAAAVLAINAIPSLSSEQRESIYTYSMEANWPIGINTLANRAKNTTTIKTYKANKLTSFDHPTKGKLYILRVPKDQNTSMTGDFALSTDIYFVMTEKVFTYK